MAKQGKIIGIDLGTTNSVVAVMEGGQPTVILNMEGGRTTPSVVAFLDNGERVVGSPAKNQAVKNPTRTIYSIKRFMGRRHSEVGEEEKIVPYKIVGGAEELVKVDIGGRQYTPPEISAMILQHLKDAAEAHLGEKVTRAVITVPAYFNDSQRQATKDAGRIAGLEVERIINEPTAAALAYGSDKKKAQKVAVYDLGGGTFDISILEIDAGVVEVKSTNGDTHLGGDDFDEVLINHVADEFRKETGINLRADQLALQRLKEECEKVKKELSSTMQATINLPFISMDASGPKHLNQSISRAKFEQLTAKLVDRTRQPCEQALKDARMKPGEVDEILMVGGSTRMPAVQRMVKEIFGKEGNRGVNPDEVVAVGAAIQGGVLGGEVDDVLLLDVTPLSLGIETLGGVFTRLIERNTTIPTQKTQVFSTASDSQPSVEIHVLQGERDMAAGNRTLGKFVLDGLPPSPRGVPQIEVSFDIDANGILNVSAKDRGTSKEQKIRIESSSGLTETEIQRMRKDAEAHASEDRKRRDLIEAKNSADQAIYQADKSLAELGDKVSADDRAEIDGAKKRLEAASKGEDIAALQAALSAFQVAIQKLGEKAYAQGQGGGKPGGGQGSSGGPGAEKGKDDSVDVEYEVKNN